MRRESTSLSEIRFLGLAQPEDDIHEFARRLIAKSEESGGVWNGRFRDHILQARPGRSLEDVLTEWTMDAHWDATGEPLPPRRVWGKGLRVLSPRGAATVVMSGGSGRGFGTKVAVDVDGEWETVLYDESEIALLNPKHGRRYPPAAFRIGEVVSFPFEPRLKWQIVSVIDDGALGPVVRLRQFSSDGDPTHCPDAEIVPNLPPLGNGELNLMKLEPEGGPERSPDVILPYKEAALGKVPTKLTWVEVAGDIAGLVGFMASLVGSAALVAIMLGWRPDTKTIALMAAWALALAGGARGTLAVHQREHDRHEPR